MGDEDPPPNRPYRIRRPSASLITSTTSPMFSAPPLQPPPSPMAHHSRHRPTNSNNNGAISQNNNFGPGDIDDDVQPSSSSSPFPPPSPRPVRISGGASANFSRNSAQSIQGPQSPLSSPDSTFWGGAVPSPSPATPYRGGPATPGGMCVVSSSTVDDVPPSPFSPAEEISNHGGGGGGANSNSGSLNSVSNLLSNPLIAGPVAGPSHNHNVSVNSGSNSGGNIVANNNGSLLVHNRISQLIVASGSGSGSSNSNQHSALISQLNQDNSIENNLPHQNQPSASSSAPSTSTNSSSSYLSSPLRNKIKKASSFERFSQQAQAASSGSSGGASGRATSGSGSIASPAMPPTDNSIPIVGSRGSSNEIISNKDANDNSEGTSNEQPISLQLSTPPQPTASSSAIVSRLSSNWEPASVANSASTSTSSFSSSSASSFRLSHNVHFGSEKSHIKIPSKKLAAKIAASVFEQEQLNEAAAMAAATNAVSTANATGTNAIIPSTSSTSTVSTDGVLLHQQHHQPSIIQSYLNNSSTSSTSQSQNSSNANSTLSQILNEAPAHHLNNMGSLVSAAEEQIMSHHHHSIQQQQQQATSNHENLIRELSESPLNLAESSSSNSSHHTSHLHHSQSQSILPQRNPVISSSRASSSSTTPSLSSSTSSSTSTLLSKKIPLTPKQKLLHRIQSGIISPPPPPQPTPPQQQHHPQHVLSLEHQIQEASTSPPQQQTVQQLAQQLQHASLSTAISTMQSAGSLQSTNLSLEQLNNSAGQGGNSTNANHLIMPHSPNSQSQLDAYYNEAIMRAREDMVVQEALGKIIDDPSNVNNMPYDAPDYAYYQSILSDDEIFTGSSQQQSAANNLSARIQQQIPGGLQDPNDALQQQQQQQQQQHSVEFVLGLPEEHERGSARADDLSLGGDGGGQQQQFLDPNDTLVAIKSHNQADSTLRNLLMMDSSRQHVTTTEEAWLLAEYQNRILSGEFNNRSSGSSSIRNGMIGSGAGTGLNTTSVLSINGLPTSIATTGWSNDWQRTSISWQHQEGVGVDPQDEVMDMSGQAMSMIEDKGNSGNSNGQSNIVISKRITHLHQYGDQMEEVNLVSDRDLANGLPLLQNMPMTMPMDLQQPMGLLQTSAGPTSLKTQLINTANGIPIDLQQHHKILSANQGSAVDMDEQPVNLMAVNLEQELNHHSNQAHHHQQQHSAAHLLPHHLAEVKSLSHQSSSPDHSNQQASGSYTLQIHQQSHPIQNDYHAQQQQQHLVEMNSLSPVLDNIDERRIIRVKKNKDNIPFGQDDGSGGLPPPNIIPDKPVQPKSHASLPSPLQLFKVGNGDDDFAVFTRNKSIPPNTRFGPVEGSLKKACAADMDTMNAIYPSLIVTDHHNNVLWKVNREDDDCCNWMKFVRMAHSIKDQNALVSEGEADGHLYFTTCKEIPPRTELQVGFSFEYAQKYGLPYLLPLQNSNANTNSNIIASPSTPPPPTNQMMEDEKITISSLQQQNALGAPSVIHGSQSYLQQQQQQLQKSIEESNQLAQSNHQSHPQQAISVSPETTSAVLTQQAPPPQKSVIVESYQCFECENEFPDVAQLQEHLDNVHKEPEIRRPKKKAIKKYQQQQQQLQQQNSAVSTTNFGNANAGIEVMDTSFSFSVENNNSSNQQQNKVDSSSQSNAVDSSDPLSMSNLPMTKKRKAASSMNAMKALSASSNANETQAVSGTENSQGLSGSDGPTHSVVQNVASVKQESVVSSGGDGVKNEKNSNNCPEIDSIGDENNDQKMQVDNGNENDVSASQPPTKVKCTMCYKSFATKERLDRHMIVHSDEDTKPLKCPFCPKRFLTNSALAGHIKTHAEEGKCFECPICTFSTQQLLQLKEHVQTHKNRDSGQFHCPQCSKKFSAYSMIRKHIRAFHGPRQYSCSQCPMSFPTSDKLKLHMLKHSDHREFLCAECGRQFKRKDKLREHTKRIHETKRKTVELTLPKDKSINKKFLPKISPEEYERFVYKCSECMVGFKRRGMLVNHLAKRHPEKPPQQVPELNMVLVRPVRNYFCLYCERVYKSSSKRKAHIIKAHPGKPVPPQARSKDIPQQLASLIEPQPLQPGTVVQTLTDDGNNTARAGVVTSSRLTGVVSTSTLAAARREAVVGKVVAQPHGCSWCHRQYATRAKLLQHQRKAHINLMPVDMQTPRTQKNNVAKKSEPSKSKSSSVIIKDEQDSVISSNVPSTKSETPKSSKISSNTSNSNAVSTTSVVVSSQSAPTPAISSTLPSGTTSATIQALQAEGLPFQTEEGGLVGILVTPVGSNVELGNLVQGDVPIVMLTTQSVGGGSAAATQAALSALQGVNFSVLQAGQVTSHGTNASPNNIISISSATSSSNNVESNSNAGSSSSASSNNSSTVRLANVIQHHQSSNSVISTTGKL